MAGSTSVRQRQDIPEAIRAVTPMRPDYVDLFVATAPAATATSPEGWARAAMEGASRAGRFVCWQLLLGLRLELEPSAGYVAGWRVADRGDRWIRVEACSWFMSANIVFMLDEDQVSFATFIRYDRRLAALVWPRVAVVHRAVAPEFLGSAVRRVARDTRVHVSR